MVTTYLSHLLPEIRYVVGFETHDRIQYIQKDNWIGYSRAKQALKKLNELYEHPQRHRMPNMLITGPTNNGKTMIIEKFCRDHPPRLRERCHYVLKDIKALREMSIISMQMLTTANPKHFYRSIIKTLYNAGAEDGCVCLSSPDENDVVKAFQIYKVRMLIIDEIHNMLASRNDQQREFQNALRYMGNALRIPIVCVGIKDAYLAIRNDPQLENRFAPFLLPTWQDDKEYQSLLASIASILPLKKPSNLNHPEISKFILEKTDGVLGEIFTLLRRAAILAIETEYECIDESILKEMDYHSPAERIKLFEQSIIG